MILVHIVMVCRQRLSLLGRLISNIKRSNHISYRSIGYIYGSNVIRSSALSAFLNLLAGFGGKGAKFAATATGQTPGLVKGFAP